MTAPAPDKYPGSETLRARAVNGSGRGKLWANFQGYTKKGENGDCFFLNATKHGVHIVIQEQHIQNKC